MYWTHLAECPVHQLNKMGFDHVHDFKLRGPANVSQLCSEATGPEESLPNGNTLGLYPHPSILCLLEAPRQAQGRLQAQNPQADWPAFCHPLGFSPVLVGPDRLPRGHAGAAPRCWAGGPDGLPNYPIPIFHLA